MWYFYNKNRGNDVTTRLFLEKCDSVLLGDGELQYLECGLHDIFTGEQNDDQQRKVRTPSIYVYNCVYEYNIHRCCRGIRDPNYMIQF